MILLESGRIGVFMMALGGERACDFAWTIHQSTPEAQRGDFSTWGDDDVCFRVLNDAITLDGRKLSIFLHGSSHDEWGIPALADVVVATGNLEGSDDVPIVRADDFDRPFDAWKQALKIGLTRLRGTEAVDAEAAPHEGVVSAMLEIGAAAIERRPNVDPLAALTLLSPGYRVGYCASYVDHEIRNGGFPQLIWNVVTADRRSLVAGGADALRTLGLDEAADRVDEALIRITRRMDLLDRCLPHGLKGFAEFRDESGLSSLNEPYWQQSRALSDRLAELARDRPEYFVVR